MEIAWYDTYPQNNSNAQVGTWGVYMFPSKKIICSNKETGLWVLKMGNIVGINNISAIAKEYKLEQNYPNPFNPSTKIKYSIPFAGNSSLSVRMIVYDITGKRVAVLVDKPQKAGIYEVDFTANNISSGIYFYKLTVLGKYTDIKKMVVIK